MKPIRTMKARQLDCKNGNRKHNTEKPISVQNEFAFANSEIKSLREGNHELTPCLWYTQNVQIDQVFVSILQVLQILQTCELAIDPGIICAHNGFAAHTN